MGQFERARQQIDQKRAHYQGLETERIEEEEKLKLLNEEQIAMDEARRKLEAQNYSLVKNTLPGLLEEANQVIFDGKANVQMWRTIKGNKHGHYTTSSTEGAEFWLYAGAHQLIVNSCSIDIPDRDRLYFYFREKKKYWRNAGEYHLFWEKIPDTEKKEGLSIGSNRDFCKSERGLALNYESEEELLDNLKQTIAETIVSSF